jgi:hypothetical protein
MSDYADRVSDNWYEGHSTSSRRWVISRRHRGRPWDLRCTLSCQRTVGPSSAGKIRRTRQEATPRSTALAVLPDFLEHSLLFGLRKSPSPPCKKPEWSASSGVAGPDGSCASGGAQKSHPGEKASPAPASVSQSVASPSLPRTGMRETRLSRGKLHAASSLARGSRDRSPRDSLARRCNAMTTRGDCTEE